MSHPSHGRRLLTGALSIAAVLVPASAAHAACSFDPASRTVTATGSEVLLRVGPGGAILAAPSVTGLYVDCGATVSTADTIVATSNSGPGHAFLALDESGGSFAPGATREAVGLSEIEIVLVRGSSAPFDVDIKGTPGDDVISVPVSGPIDLDGDGDGDVGQERRTTIDAGDGNDRIRVESEDASGFYGPRVTGGPGDDVISTSSPLLAYVTGGPGMDTVDLSGMGVGIELDLATGTGSVADDGRPFWVGDDFEGAVSGPGDDHLVGTGGPNVLSGGRGADVLEGLAGRDVLLDGRGADVSRGGAGTDVLTSGPGHDQLFGEGGNDLIVARDDPGQSDVVHGGDGGGDHAQVDGLDAVSGVELID